jgi:ribonuclease P protein component
MNAGPARRPESRSEGPRAPHTRTPEIKGHAFPKHFRLLRRADFRRVYEKGQRRSASLCTVFFHSNGLTYSRLGITVPARVGNAVMRNRIKRRLREIFRLNRPEIAAGWDIVVNPRAQAAEADFLKLQREFLRLLPGTGGEPKGDPARPAGGPPRS